MRPSAQHRHGRSSPLPVSYLIALLAALAAALAAAVFAAQTAPAQAQVQKPSLGARLLDRSAEINSVSDETSLSADKTVVSAIRLAAYRAQAALAAATYTVRSGDSISGVASRRCDAARDWTGIYAASRAKGWTAKNANYLTSGQHLFIACFYDAGQLKYAPKPPPPPRPAIRVLSRVHHASVSSSAAPAYVSSGVYSYGALEALWESAGGPAWAASRAAEIAECESGGNPGAYNPSGATGLWQILGSVVAGNLDNAFTNALNAVSKFRASGDTFAQWVCQ
jgi:hypothetical protein